MADDFRLHTYDQIPLSVKIAVAQLVHVVVEQGERRVKRGAVEVNGRFVGVVHTADDVVHWRRLKHLQQVSYGVRMDDVRFEPDQDVQLAGIVLLTLSRFGVEILECGI